MELKDIIKIFKLNINLFFTIFIVFVLVGLIIAFFQKERQVANLMINISREGVQETQDYRYDDFYRLQADERFSDTVVRWIASPSIINEIKNKSEIDEIPKIKARRLSSQMIEIIFEVKDVEQAKKISSAITSVLNQQSKKLNEKQNSKSWFLIISNPVEVLDGKIKFGIIFFASLMLGLFFAVMGVTIKNYLKD